MPFPVENISPMRSATLNVVGRLHQLCEACFPFSVIPWISVLLSLRSPIGQSKIEKLAVDDFDIGQCRGQSYDNGSNIAGIHVLVQARIAERNELPSLYRAWLTP